MIIEHRPSVRKIDPLISVIKSCPFFSDMSIYKIRGLLPYFKKKILHQDEILFNRGENSNSIYILTQGKLVGTLEILEGGEKIVEIINTVEIVGELEVISGETRSFTVKALEYSELLEFPSHLFIQLFQKNQHHTLEVMKLISRRSVEAIKLITKKKPQQFIVIFTNKQNLSIESFIENLSNNIKHYPQIIMPHQTMTASERRVFVDSLDQMIEELNHNQDKEQKHRIVFIDQYQPELFKFLTEQNSRFYLLANGDDHVFLDIFAKEIIDQLNYTKKEGANIPLSLILLHQDNVKQPKYTKHWLTKSDFQLVHHVKLNDHLNYQRLIRFAIGRATGLVLSGGGMRGYAHLGVIKALLERNIDIDMIGGVSVGASVAAYYSAFPNYEKIQKMSKVGAKSIRNSFRFRNLTLPVISIFNGRIATKLAQDIFKDQCMEDLWIPCFCLSANISTISEMVHRTGPIWQAVRSSNSLPGLMPPVVINGELHCDGGIVNNLPVDVMRKFLGPRSKIIASEVTYLSKDDTHYCFPPSFSLKESILYKLGLSRKYYRVPHFMDTFLKSLLLGAAAKEKQNSLAADLLIHPDMSHFHTFKIKKNDAEKLILSGYQETLRQLEIKNFGSLNKKEKKLEENKLEIKPINSFERITKSEKSTISLTQSTTGDQSSVLKLN